MIDPATINPTAHQPQKQTNPGIVPTIGRVVLYCLSQQDADAINRRRTDGFSIRERMQQEPAAWPAGAQAHIGNHAYAGDVFPADIVRVWGDQPDSAVNLQVKLDGNDTYWVTSATVSEEPVQGRYHWMPYQKGQAAKVDDLTPRVERLERRDRPMGNSVDPPGSA